MQINIRKDKITQYIRETAMTVCAFCERCRISPSTYYKIMRGNNNICISVLFKIARETGEPIAALIAESDE